MRFGWVLPFFSSTCLLLAQTSDSSSTTAKSPDQLKGILAETFAKDTFAYLPGPYHFLAAFETFSSDGKLAGEGSIEKFFTSPGHLKMITRFNGQTMTEYYNGGPPKYTDDGFDGSIMSYFVRDFLLTPLPPPTGTARPNLESEIMQLDGSVLDCGTYQFYVEPPGLPTLSKEKLCVSRSLDLVYRQTLVFSIRYSDYIAFLGRSIPREIVALEGPVVRCRIHMKQVDQQALDDQVLNAPPGASPAKPGPEWYASSRADSIPRQHPLPKGLMQLSAAPGPSLSKFLVLRSRTGSVIDVQPIYAPNAEVKQAGMDALMQWTFAPFLRQGAAVETISTIYLDSPLQ